jgi:hypothetical protein
LNGGSEQEHLLMTLIDAIAVDFLIPEFFERLFRSDKFFCSIISAFHPRGISPPSVRRNPYFAPDPSSNVQAPL